MASFYSKKGEQLACGFGSIGNHLTWSLSMDRAVPIAALWQTWKNGF
jgi:hypothetical protein